jgi:hypothetical protein
VVLYATLCRPTSSIIHGFARKLFFDLQELQGINEWFSLVRGGGQVLVSLRSFTVPFSFLSLPTVIKQ